MKNVEKNINKNIVISLIIIFVSSMIASWIIGWEGIKGFGVTIIIAMGATIGFYYADKEEEKRK